MRIQSSRAALFQGDNRHRVRNRLNDYKVSLFKDLSALQLLLLTLFRGDGTVWSKYKYGIEDLWQPSQFSPDVIDPQTKNNTNKFQHF